MKERMLFCQSLVNVSPPGNTFYFASFFLSFTYFKVILRIPENTFSDNLLSVSPPGFLRKDQIPPCLAKTTRNFENLKDIKIPGIYTDIFSFLHPFYLSHTRTPDRNKRAFCPFPTTYRHISGISAGKAFAMSSHRILDCSRSHNTFFPSVSS